MTSIGAGVKCNGLFGVHRFEARFDSRIPEEIKTGQFEGFAADYIKMLDVLRTKTYVRDVCVKCGAVIERTE